MKWLISPFLLYNLSPPRWGSIHPEKGEEGTCTAKNRRGPGQVALLVTALSTKVVGSISGQGTLKKQPMNA